MELLEEILARDNMNKAYKKVCQNKGVIGVDDITVEKIRRVFERKWRKNIKQNKEKRIQTATSKKKSRYQKKMARKLNFVRYANDCIILVRSEKATDRVLGSITKYIEKKLGLKVNAEKSKVTRPTQTNLLFGIVLDIIIKVSYPDKRVE